MTDSKPPERGVVNATIDSVSTAVGMLWDWLSAPPPKPEEKERSILDFLPDSTEPKPDGQIPAEVVSNPFEEAREQVIETQGEGVDDV